MNREVAGAQASTLAEWAELWRRHGGEAGQQVGLLLDRAARIVHGVSINVSVALEPVEAKEAPVDLPKDG